MVSLAQKGVQLFSGLLPLKRVLNLITSGLDINGSNKFFKKYGSCRLLCNVPVVRVKYLQ